MNKTQLVDYIANEAEISKVSANKVLDATLDAITKELASGGSVTLVGFGTFSVSERAARAGRNPRTGETLQIAAAKVPKFKVGKVLKDSCN